MSEDHRTGVPGQGEERDPALDRVYRATATAGPPPHLDAAILAAARREVGARPRPAGLQRWRVPVSLAAVIVLSVSLVTLIGEEGGEPLKVTPPAPPARAPSPAAAPSTPAAMVAEDRRSSPDAEAPVARAPQPEAAAPAGPPPALGRAAEVDTGEPVAPDRSLGAGAAVPPESGSRARPQPMRDAPTPADRPVAASEDLASPPPPRAAAPAAQPPSRQAARMSSEARKEGAAEEARSPAWQAYENEPPHKWLDRIAELRRQHRPAEADAMLAEFKRRFPGHPVPVEGR